VEVEQVEHDINPRMTPMTETKLREETQQDETLQLLSVMIKTGWPSDKDNIDIQLRPYWDYRDTLTMMNGIIYKGMKAVIPRNMHKEMLNKIHANHQGAENSIRMAREVLFWPGMRGAIQNTCESCGECAVYQVQAPTEPMKSLPTPDLPWQLVSQDIVKYNGSNYLVTVDHYSDFIEVDELIDTLAKTIVCKTKQQFSRHGIPQQLHTDNGPQFISNEFQTFSRNYNFHHTTSSPYWSRGNGRAEAAVKVVENMLKKSKDIHLALLNYRNTPQRGHNYSPSQRLMSRRTRTLLPTAHQLLTPAAVDNDRVVEQIQMKKNKAKEQYDRRAGIEHLPIPVGHHVYAKPPPNRPTDPWSYGMVTAMNGPRSYTVQGQHRTVRRNRVQLRPAAPPPAGWKMTATPTWRQTPPLNISVQHRNNPPAQNDNESGENVGAQTSPKKSAQAQVPVVPDPTPMADLAVSPPRRAPSPYITRHGRQVIPKKIFEP
jgi:hypothetical protein